MASGTAFDSGDHHRFVIAGRFRCTSGWISCLVTVSAIDSAVCGVIVQTVLEPTTGDQRLCSSGKRGKYRHVGDRLLVVALQALGLDRFPRCCDINRSVKRIGGGGISKSLARLWR